MTTAWAGNWASLLNNFPPFTGQDVSAATGANFIVNRTQWETYLWLVVVGAFFSFAMAWSIGANDVANAFGTSVGAKTLTLWQACLIATVFEFVGALTLGGEVVRTVAGSVTSPTIFAAVPEVFAFGMLCALASASSIVTVATYFSAAVSTTHSIIGAVIGFGLIFGGADAIVWNEKIPDFPYRRGVVTIFLSWFISPVLAGCFGAILFLLNKFIILRRKEPFNWAFYSMPVLILFTVWLNLFFVLLKGAGKELGWDKQGKKASWVAMCAAAGAAVVSIPFMFWMKKRMLARFAAEEAAEIEAQANKDKLGKDSPTSADNDKLSSEPEVVRTGVMGFADRIKNQLKYSLTVDIHQDVQKDERVQAIHDFAEVFDPKAEEVYKILQVFSACAVSFTHGANDVANAVGPFAGIWHVYNKFTTTSNADSPKWILALGGIGIVVGLGTYGYNIMKVLGVQMAKMTPSRGYSAEMGTALTIAIATIYGLPVSTTQAIVGAEVGVGFAEDIRGRGTNWRLFGKTMVGWVIAFTFSGICSAALFAFCVYAPSLNDLDYVNNYHFAMTNVMRTQLRLLNNTQAFPNTTFPTLLRNVSGLSTNITSLNNFRTFGKVNQYDMMAVLKNTTWLYINATLPRVNGSTPLSG